MPLTANGLIIPRFSEIIASLESKERAKINQNINTSDDELLGQYNSILTEIIASVYELAEAVNDNFNIDKAEGKNLDDLGALKDVLRLQATHTQGDQYFTGDTLTIIPAGFLVDNPTTGKRFALQDEVVLSTNEVLEAVISVVTVSNSTLYTIVVDGNSYSYTSDSSATQTEILNGLESEISGSVGINFSAEVNTSAGTITITADEGEFLSISSTNNLSVDKVTVQGYMVAQESGPVLAPSGEVNEIVTPILGLDSTINPESFVVGRERETDELYRIRIKSDQAVLGKCTIPAIEANMRNLSGVSYAVAIQNNTMTDDVDGRPPKSVEVIVEGATDEAVALSLWQVVGAGIQTYGSTTVAFQDEDDQSQEVSFSRPTIINIAARVTYSLYSEEVFPSSGGEDSIRQAVYDYINSLGIGIDVIPKRVYGPIYNAVDGIGDLTVEVQTLTNSGDPPVGGSWQEIPLSIAASEFPHIELIDITVTEV